MNIMKLVTLEEGESERLDVFAFMTQRRLKGNTVSLGEKGTLLQNSLMMTR